MLGLSAIAYPLGSLALTGASLWFKSDLSEFGFGVGTNLVSSLLAATPDWLRSQFPRRPGEPNHDLAHAFHQALNDTLVHACNGKPIKSFQAECPEAWGALHQGLRNGITQWFAYLVTAAADKSKAGTAPLVPLNDAFLKELLEDNGDTALSRLRALLQQDLQQRLSMQAISPGTDAVLDDDALKALTQFVDWLCRHLDTQMQLFFLEQLKPTAKGPSPAWISYQFLLGQAMQKHLGEIADHAVETRQAIHQIITLLKSSQGLPSLVNWPQQEVARLEKRLIQEIKALGGSIESLTRQMHQRFDATPANVADELERRRLLKSHSEFKADISRIDRYAPADLIGRESETALLNDAWTKVRTAEPKRPHILTFVALGGEGKTSLIAKWAADLAHQNWPGCDAVFAWSFYSQGTRDQVAASSDLFLKEALTFFGNDEDQAFAASPAGAHEKGQRLARIIGQWRSLLILDGLEPLQYAPTSPTPGEIKDQGIIALLKGLSTNSQGLCIVTTRYSIPNLKAYRQTTALEVPLLRLSREAGVHLLQSFGIKGSLLRNPEQGPHKEKLNEFEQLVEDVKGHALTLNLLGTYLRDAHGGDIRKRDLIKFEDADSENEHPNHAAHVMDAYVQWFETGGKTEDENKKGLRALALLRLLGLFDRPASADSLSALWAGDAIPQLTEPLAGLSDAQRNIALARLENAKLLTVSRDASGTLLSLDAHPHLREYFARQLREKSPDVWRAAHRRLYEHLCVTTKEGDQPTLESLQPLYQAIAHGCHAGIPEEARNVYIKRIQMGDRFYSSQVLGADSLDLTAVASFFEGSWTTPSPLLEEPAQAWVMNDAAVCLRATGRLREALEPLRTSAFLCFMGESWEGSARCSYNLSELHLTIGDIDDSISEARHALRSAQFSRNGHLVILCETAQADAMHQAGNLSEAMRLFRHAEGIQSHRNPDFPLLYGSQSFRYCNLLLRKNEILSWRSILNTRIDNSELGLPETDGPSYTQLLDRVQYAQKISIEHNWNLNLALDLLTMARLNLYFGISTNEFTSSERNNRQGYLTVVTCQINEGMVSFLREMQKQYFPEFLLTRGWTRFIEGAHTGCDSCQEDLDEAWEIAERGPMPLFMADIYLYRARLFGLTEAGRALPEYPWWPSSPQADLAEARKLIEKCGYWRRKEELEDAEAVFGRLA